MSEFNRFSHVEQSDDQLFDRINDLMDEKKSWVSERRRTAISKEIGYLVFEQEQRYLAAHQDEAVDLARLA